MKHIVFASAPVRAIIPARNQIALLGMRQLQLSARKAASLALRGICNFTANACSDPNSAGARFT